MPKNTFEKSIERDRDYHIMGNKIADVIEPPKEHCMNKGMVIVVAYDT